MLRYHNPLDEYRSYSVHFVMLACRTTQQAEAFSSTAATAETLAAIDSVRSLGDPVPYGDGRDVFLVLDTRRFSQFTVDSLNFEVLVNGLEREGSHANFASRLKMNIVDSVGISFVNYLQWLLDEQMQANFDGMVLMLRVMFMGHRDDGREPELVETDTIPMQLLTMDLSLDHARGVYACEFMPIVNFDVRRNDRWLNVGKVTHYFTGPGTNRLVDLVNDFERRLNEESRRLFDAASTGRAAAGATSRVDSAGLRKYGRLVQYVITLPEAWSEFTFTGANTGAAHETVFKKLARELSAKEGSGASPSAPKDSHVAVEPGVLITDALDAIFSQVAAVHGLATAESAQSRGGVKTFYKYLVGVSSDDDTFIVHVDVVEFRVPDALVDDRSGLSGDGDLYDIRDGKRVPKSYFELDYIFTGKNTQILGFDMKIENLSFFIASVGNLGRSAVYGMAEAGQSGPSTGLPSRKPSVQGLRAYDPILIPPPTGDELTVNSTGAAREYTRALSAFYANSPVKVNVTVRGNPAIMTKFNVPRPLEHRHVVTSGAQGLSATNAAEKAAYRRALEQRILADNGGRLAGAGGSFTVVGGPSYMTTPAFVKLNIRGPRVDFATNSPVPERDGADGEYAADVVTDAYFRVMKVTNKIEGGTFTQDIEMWSNSAFGVGSQ